MKGTNTLRLNEATLIDAMQEYLAKRMPGAPRVTKVEWDGDVFVVCITDDKTGPGK